ncbi:MAG: hypothetical protein G01um101438_761 [Parcubacteria group bacterium Gr01-1014_38]|nr:MAG: hypothetical protein G01um101438_761 [Parcubacteria group bacterium Gr01-1014_38]
MGLWDFLFGPRVPPEEEARLSEEQEHRRYGHLAERENLAEALRQAGEGREREERKETEDGESEEPVSTYHVPRRYERAAGRLRERLSKHGDLMPRWWRQRRGLGRYMKTLEEAESRREAYQVFQRGRGLSPSPGRLRKVEGKLEQAEKSLYRKYEGGDVSRPQFARKQRELGRSFRDLRRLSRWR